MPKHTHNESAVQTPTKFITLQTQCVSEISNKEVITIKESHFTEVGQLPRFLFFSIKALSETVSQV